MIFKYPLLVLQTFKSFLHSDKMPGFHKNHAIEHMAQEEDYRQW